MNKSDVVTITTGRLNTVNDLYPGGGTDSPGLRVGQLGAALQLNYDQALALSDTSVGTLYAGVYQYVKFYVSQSGTTIKGGPVYWQDPTAFVVTADVPTGAPGFAGVALSVPTKGNCAFILVEGECQCQPLDNTTKTTPAIGDTMVTATIGRFDDLADATAFDGTNFKLIAGQWITAPADATSTRYLAYVQFAKRLASSI
jgi:hypothetical protein